MNAQIASIWRYPIKGIGAESLNSVDLEQARPIPFDRSWAVLEQGGDEAPGWRSCRNFLRGAKGPALMGIMCKSEGATLHLSHFDRPDLTFTPNEDPDQVLFDWLAPIYPEDRRAPFKIETAPVEGMADAPFASISILNLSSLRALSQKAGRELDLRRFRGNIWLDGLAPWEEFDLIGKTLVCGTATLEIVESISRCRATEANPDTGLRDTPTLKVLETGWGHTDFGVYAKVLTSGHLSTGDSVQIL